MGYIRLYEEGLFKSKETRRIEIGRKERGADLFAANLLITEEWVKDSWDAIAETAEEFQVSESFMRKILESKSQRG